MSRTWQAGFVTPPSGDWTVPGHPAAYFRREFLVGGTPRKATLHVTAVGLVEPHLNGARVGSAVLVPGWTSYRHRLAVSTHDVTSLIAPGLNAVGAVVGEGWAVGRIGYEGKRNHYADRPALFLQLDLEYTDGRVETIGTDDSFLAGSGGVRANSLYDGEDYDARVEPAGWDSPGFDDPSWCPVVPFDWKTTTLVTAEAPPIRRVEELSAVEILTSPDGKPIVDFGQNISGWVRLTASGDAGTTVTLRHAEVLVGGRLATETLRTAASTDRYTFRGGSQETWEPRFTFHGFRYVEVDGFPGTLRPEDLTAIVVHSDMTRTGWFETSDPLLNRLHTNVVWSMRDNFVGVPTDCPQRDERLGWTGDINAFAPTAAFLYDVRGVLGDWLKDLVAEQAEKGFVPMVVPDVLSTPSPPTALWSDVVVSLPWALYQEYGDEGVLRRNYRAMCQFVDSVEKLLDDTGIWNSGFQFGDWLDPDAPSDNAAGGKTDRYLVATAFFHRVTTQLACAADVVGEAADHDRYIALAQRVREGFRREYVTESGRVVGETATAYALAIVFGLLTDQQRAKAGDELAKLVTKAGYRVSTGFAGTPFVTDALTDTGHLDEAYLLLMETGCPSFLYPVTQGATTIWERWDAIRPDGTLNPSGGVASLNHYALGAVADWLHRVVGGLRAEEPGYRTIRIAPRPGGGLTHATVTHDTVRGRAAVAWRITGRQMTVEVTVPEATEAVVELPLHPDAAVETVAAGTHSWSYPLPEEYGVRQEYTMDTSLRTLAADPVVWHALTTVFTRHFPGIPIDATGPEAAGTSLAILLQYIPEASAQLEADLRTAIGLQDG